MLACGALDRPQLQCSYGSQEVLKHLTGLKQPARVISLPVVQMLFFKKHAMCTTQRFPRLWLHDDPGHVIHKRVFLSVVHMQDLHPSLHIIHSADSFSMATKCIPACSHSGILRSLVHMGHFQTRLRVAIRQFCSLWSKYKAM